MAVFSLEIADDDVQRVLQAVAINSGWQSHVVNPEYVMQEDEEGNPIEPVDAEGNPIPEEIENPETIGDCTHRMVRRYLQEHVQSYELRLARKEAANNLNTDVSISDPEA